MLVRGFRKPAGRADINRAVSAFSRPTIVNDHARWALNLFFRPPGRITGSIRRFYGGPLGPNESGAPRTLPLPPILRSGSEGFRQPIISRGAGPRSRKANSLVPIWWRRARPPRSPAAQLGGERPAWSKFVASRICKEARALDMVHVPFTKDFTQAITILAEGAAST